MKQLRFDTADMPPALRLDAFARASTEYLVETSGPPEDFWMRSVATVVGALIVVEVHAAPVRCIRTVEHLKGDRRDYFSFFLMIAGEARVVFEPGQPPVRVRPGGVLAMDRAHPVDAWSDGDTHCIAMAFPRHWLEEVLPGVRLHRALRPSPALRVAADYVQRLVASLPNLSEEAAHLYARSLRDLFAAAIVEQFPEATPGGAPVATLLARAVVHVDAHLATPLDVAKLGRVLGASRSSLYRAARPMGGVVSLIRQRRLAAVHRRLADPADGRSIATIALECGFTDLSLFSRQFRRTFGETASDVRARGGPRPPELADYGSVQERYRAVVSDLAADRGRSLPV